MQSEYYHLFQLTKSTTCQMQIPKLANKKIKTQPSWKCTLFIEFLQTSYSFTEPLNFDSVSINSKSWQY